VRLGVELKTKEKKRGPPSAEGSRWGGRRSPRPTHRKDMGGVSFRLGLNLTRAKGKRVGGDAGNRRPPRAGAPLAKIWISKRRMRLGSLVDDSEGKGKVGKKQTEKRVCRGRGYKAQHHTKKKRAVVRKSIAERKHTSVPGRATWERGNKRAGGTGSTN